ncbi:MAG: Crp/Fnr family transcriptional regulator [Eubacterium sp.]|nr:Crp/Fnr family transcriptional regulator [Eubacterium sp.]
MDQKHFNTIRLFRNLTENEIDQLLNLLQAEEKDFSRGTCIFHAGQTTTRMGLVLAGSVTIESNDLWGNRTILSLAGEGSIFAETYALLENEPMLVDVVANEDSRILMLNAGRQEMQLHGGESWMMKYMANFLAISAQKNLNLSGRSFHTAPKTIRGRVMSYLNAVALKQQCSSFTIPFDRQQLADYLNLDRSALSKELGKMQREGLITVRKNHFVLHQSTVEVR